MGLIMINDGLMMLLWKAGDDYFVELRARAPAAMPSNYSSFFSVLDVSLGGKRTALSDRCQNRTWNSAGLKLLGGFKYLIV